MRLIRSPSVSASPVKGIEQLEFPFSCQFSWKSVIKCEMALCKKKRQQNMKVRKKNEIFICLSIKLYNDFKYNNMLIQQFYVLFVNWRIQLSCINVF